MKYRRLTVEELNSLEKPFIEFLISNGIAAADWERIKQSEQQKAEEILGIFSDLVMQKTLENIRYVECRSKNRMMIFRFDKDRVVMAGIEVTNVEIDFGSRSSLETLIADQENMEKGNFQLIRSEKVYTRERELELFEMTEAGCLVTDNKLFDILRSLKT